MHIYNTDTLRTNHDIPRILFGHEGSFSRVNVTDYNAVNMIHVVIRTAIPFSYTAKFMCCRS